MHQALLQNLAYCYRRNRHRTDRLLAKFQPGDTIPKLANRRQNNCIQLLRNFRQLCRQILCRSIGFRVRIQIGPLGSFQLQQQGGEHIAQPVHELTHLLPFDLDLTPVGLAAHGAIKGQPLHVIQLLADTLLLAHEARHPADELFDALPDLSGKVSDLGQQRHDCPLVALLGATPYRGCQLAATRQPAQQ